MTKATTLEVDRRLEVTVTSDGTRLWCCEWWCRGQMIGATDWVPNPIQAHRLGVREDREYRRVLDRRYASAA